MRLVSSKSCPEPNQAILMISSETSTQNVKNLMYWQNFGAFK